jgi:hypothetical protein
VVQPRRAGAGPRGHADAGGAVGRAALIAFPSTNTTGPRRVGAAP